MAILNFRKKSTKTPSDIEKIASHHLMKKLPGSAQIPKENVFSFILSNYLIPKPHDVIRYYAMLTHGHEPVTLTDEIVWDLTVLYRRIENIPIDEIDEIDEIEESCDVIGKDALINCKWFLHTLLHEAEENSVEYTLYDVLDEISELYEFFFPTTCLQTMAFQDTVAKIIAAQKNPDEKKITLIMMDLILDFLKEGKKNESLHPLTLYPFSTIEELPIALDYYIPL